MSDSRLRAPRLCCGFIVWYISCIIIAALETSSLEASSLLGLADLGASGSGVVVGLYGVRAGYFISVGSFVL